MTVKNYGKTGGLSTILHGSNDEVYEIQGPMGKGLDIEKTGTHIAFTAGTGLLIFIDLVAHLVRKNCGLLTPAEDKMLDLKYFKFVLFSSF